MAKHLVHVDSALFRYLAPDPDTIKALNQEQWVQIRTALANTFGFAVELLDEARK